MYNVLTSLWSAASTIETQDDQLAGLHTQLEETSARQTREKQELMDWCGVRL